MPLVLQNVRAVHVAVLEHALVHDHELPVEAGVDLEILGRLHAYGREELVVKGIDWHEHVLSVRNFDLVLIEDLLPIVNYEARTVDPYEIRFYSQQAMVSGFFGIRSWYNLNWVEISNVPNYQLICYVKSEDERPLLNHINGANRILMAFQAAQVCIPEQVLRTPHVRIYFKACTDDHSAETLHVA